MKSVPLLLLPAILFSAYPLAVVAGANVESLPLDAFVFLRAALVAVGVIVLVVWLLGWLQPDLPARAMWINWVLLVFILYESCIRAGQLLGFGIDARDLPTGAMYLAAALALTTLASRPWQARPRDPRPLSLFAAALLAVTLYPVGAWAVAHRDEPWRQPANALIESALSTATVKRPTPDRDIYYFVLDGFGRPDVLAEIYDADLSSFVAYLKSKGFHVPEHAKSNYAQTFLSLSSTLNMNYLDPIAASMTSSQDRRPLEYLIQQNALMRAARSAGYRIVAIGSDYMATERWTNADECVCSRFGLDEIEQSALEKTPFALLPMDRWASQAHRRKVLDSLSAPLAASGRRQPSFVFAHIILPHPPFVFRGDGTVRSLREKGRFSFSDGDHFVGSRLDYIEGYREQALFATGQLTRLVDSLLSRQKVQPVIVIHGDHGPGSLLLWDDPARTNLRERMSIFAAYYFPDSDQAWHSAISPVNGARMLATRYLGLNLPPLADRTFFSTWKKPYEFVPVDGTLQE